MDLLTIITLLITISAAFSYLNVRFLKLPGTIGVMVVAIVVSLMVLIAGKTDKGIGGAITTLTHSIDFSKILLDILLGFLLFASALHFDFGKLKEQRRAVLVLSTIGVVISTCIFGFLLYGIVGFIGVDLPLIFCLLFGALISPTDPIAVGSVLKTSIIPPRLETIISGESMFNDAVGLILFVTLLSVADTSVANPTIRHTMGLFAREVLGGLAIGLSVGFIGYRLMRSIKDFQTILLLSIALVLGISLLASKAHASVPLAVVAAGLLVGNQDFGEDNPANQYLVQVWRLLDEVLNTIVFVMMGLQLVVLPSIASHWLLGLVCIFVLLVARFISLYLPARVALKKVTPGNLAILTWAGLRGGISIAMALSVPESEHRETILAATYIVVVFSVIVQGLTLNRVISASVKHTEANMPAVQQDLFN